MAVIQVKKYKIIKDENGNKIQVLKTKEEWNKETKGGTATWYFSERYEINGIIKQYKSALFTLKRAAEDERRLFLINPIEYIKNNSKKAKNKLSGIIEIIQDKTLDDYFADFIEYEMSYNKESTAYAHKTTWYKHISPILGKFKPNEINFALIQNWHEHINVKINDKTRDYYSVESKNSFHSTLVSFLQYLFQKGLIDLNYAKIIGSFKNTNLNKNERKKVKHQTLEEFNRFMECVDDDFWYIFFNFAFWHGPRKGEQRALKIKDINLEYDTIYFHSTFSRNKNGGEKIGTIKNGKERITYLAPQSKKYITKLINFYKQMNNYSDDWFLFGGPFKISKNSIERALHHYYSVLREKYPNIEVNELTHHEFGRHSHASFLLNIGCDREDIYFIIAERLGDTPEVIRNTYAKPYETLNNDKSKLLLSASNINNKLNLKGENVT